MKLSVYAKTDIGLRRGNNEDNFVVNTTYLQPENLPNADFSENCDAGVFAVCDGMGGEEYGEYASLCGVAAISARHRTILQTAPDMREALVGQVLRDTNRKICEEMERRNARIGSTVAMVCVTGGTADVFNIGDSRVYLYRTGKLQQLSIDHTVLQQMLDLGICSKETAHNRREKNQLTQHLGIFEREMLLEAHHMAVQTEQNDLLILCSDGLTDMLTDDKIEAVCGASSAPRQAADDLVATALKNGGKDNITVIVIAVNQS